MNDFDTELPKLPMQRSDQSPACAATTFAAMPPQSARSCELVIELLAHRLDAMQNALKMATHWIDRDNVNGPRDLRVCFDELTATQALQVDMLQLWSHLNLPECHGMMTWVIDDGEA